MIEETGSETSAGNLSARECELCGRAMAPHWEIPDHHGHRWSYLCCEGCRLVRLKMDRPRGIWRELAYGGSYYGDGYSKFTGAIQVLRELSAWRRAREVSALFQRPGKALDIGCGEGLFLNSMKQLGWSVAGCETGGQAASRAEEVLGQPIHRGEFETMDGSPGPWEVVMLWHVLEHVSDPVGLLRRIAGALAEGGLLILAVPNATSWQARFFGPHWFHLDPPRHLSSWGMDHLTRLAEKTGWRIIESHHFSLEYNPFGWAQSLLNALGWKRDAMYETLKRHAKPVKGALMHRIAAWTLLGPSIIPAILEAAAKQGGTVALYLRKT